MTARDEIVAAAKEQGWSQLAVQSNTRWTKGIYTVRFYFRIDGKLSEMSISSSEKTNHVLPHAREKKELALRWLSTPGAYV